MQLSWMKNYPNEIFEQFWVFYYSIKLFLLFLNPLFVSKHDYWRGKILSITRETFTKMRFCHAFRNRVQNAPWNRTCKWSLAEKKTFSFKILINLAQADLLMLKSDLSCHFLPPSSVLNSMLSSGPNPFRFLAATVTWWQRHKTFFIHHCCSGRISKSVCPCHVFSSKLNNSGIKLNNEAV